MHSRKIVALILYVSSYLSCSNSRTFVSISGHAVDKNTSQHFLGSKTESGFWSCGGGGYSTAVGFVRNFAAYAENMPFPVVVWAGDAKRTGHAEFMVNSEEPCFEIPNHKPWVEALNSISRWAGPYHARELPGFLEIIWTDGENENRIRRSMGQSVPPILFRSRKAVDSVADNAREALDTVTGKQVLELLYEVPVFHTDQAVLRFSYGCGSLCSGGFLGRMKEVNGNWFVTRWQRLWLS